MREKFTTIALGIDDPIKLENTAAIIVDVTRHCLQFFTPDEIQNITNQVEKFLDESGLKAVYFYTPNQQLIDKDWKDITNGEKVPPNQVLKIRETWRSNSENTFMSYNEYKIYQSCFERTNLEAFLKHRGIDTVIILGVEKPLCAWDTALDASQRGFRTYFLDDLTYTSSIVQKGERYFEITPSLARVNNINFTNSNSFLNSLASHRLKANIALAQKPSDQDLTGQNPT